jgi:arylsulfatase A-like enzyme
MPARDRPNVLWICTDQQRWDTLGCYGNERVATPTLDALAAEGVRFDRTYCQSPVCTPSRASFLTGRYPRTTRCRQNGQAVPDGELFVTRTLAEAGYTCGLAGKLHTAPANPEDTRGVKMAERRIDDGYADFHWSHDSFNRLWPTNEYDQWLAERGVEYDVRLREDSEYVHDGMPAEHHQTTWCAERAATFVAEAARFDDPWLFSVNVFDPHHPFDPPREYLERYLDDLGDVPLPAYREGELADKPAVQRHPPSRESNPFAEMSDRDHRLLRAAYWAMCDLIDDQVERMLAALEETGQREDTLVIFTSDHGELLGDHGIYLKGPFFYEPAVRVPLLVAGPGVEAGATDALVELVDLAPTLCDAAGVEAPPGTQGRSLWPLLTGDADRGREAHRRDVYCEYYHALEGADFFGADGLLQRAGAESDLDPHFRDPFVGPDVLDRFRDQVDADTALPYATMLRTDRYKLVAHHGVDGGELYDLEADPGEHRNRYGDPAYADAKADLLERLTDRMAGTVDPLPERTARW